MRRNRQTRLSILDWQAKPRSSGNHVPPAIGRHPAIIHGLAQEADLQDPGKFAQIWHMLMKGSIVSAREGNRNAAREAKQAARIVIRNWRTVQQP